MNKVDKYADSTYASTDGDSSVFSNKTSICRLLNKYTNFLEKNENMCGSPWLWRHGAVLYSVVNSYDDDSNAYNNFTLGESMMAFVVLAAIFFISVFDFDFYFRFHRQPKYHTD